LTKKVPESKGPKGKGAGKSWNEAVKKDVAKKAGKKEEKPIVDVGQKRGRRATTPEKTTSTKKASSVDSGRFKRAATAVGKQAKASNALLKHSKTTTERRGRKWIKHWSWIVIYLS
jgi:hypothetical protein